MGNRIWNPVTGSFASSSGYARTKSSVRRTAAEIAEKSIRIARDVRRERTQMVRCCEGVVVETDGSQYWRSVRVHGGKAQTQVVMSYGISRGWRTTPRSAQEIGRYILQG